MGALGANIVCPPISTSPLNAEPLLPNQRFSLRQWLADLAQLQAGGINPAEVPTPTVAVEMEFREGITLGALEVSLQQQFGEPPLTPPAGVQCDWVSYPHWAHCIRLIAEGDLNCGDLVVSNFPVDLDANPRDPHRFDGDANGWGCQTDSPLAPRVVVDFPDAVEEVTVGDWQEFALEIYNPGLHHLILFVDTDHGEVEIVPNSENAHLAIQRIPKEGGGFALVVWVPPDLGGTGNSTNFTIRYQNMSVSPEVGGWDGLYVSGFMKGDGDIGHPVTLSGWEFRVVNPATQTPTVSPSPPPTPTATNPPNTPTLRPSYTSTASPFPTPTRSAELTRTPTPTTVIPSETPTRVIPPTPSPGTIIRTVYMPLIVR